VSLAEEPESLVLHVIAAPTAAQIEAELGEGEEAEGAEAAPAPPSVATPSGEGGQPEASAGQSS
jgi:hypothetical protein